MVVPVNKPSFLSGTLAHFLILQKNRPPRNPPFLNRLFDQPLFSSKFSLPLLHFDEHDTNRVSLLVLHLSIPVKDNKVDRVADEPGISRRKRKLRQKRGHLLGDPALQRGTRAVDGILPDIVCAFELPAFEIVSSPPFDCADLLAEEEERGDDAEDECDDGDEEVGWGHENPDKGLIVREI
jgi:hypothetical protein